MMKIRFIYARQNRQSKQAAWQTIVTIMIANSSTKMNDKQFFQKLLLSSVLLAHLIR